MTLLEKKPLDQRGFTLIEIMITVVIIGILAAIAIPNYTQSVVESRRSQATTAVTKVASDLERYYYNNNSYTKDMTDLGYTADPHKTDNGFYEVDVVAGPSGDINSSFRIEADAIGQQASDDPDCNQFFLNSQGKQWSENTSDADTTSICW